MKATLRSPAAAAAMLLASLGAALVAQPAAAQSSYGYGYGYAQPRYSQPGYAQPGYAYSQPTYPQPAVVAQPDFRGDHDHGEHRRFARDNRGPWIGDITASQGGRGRIRIAARFGDRDSGVDPASVVLLVDGRDVTHHARVDDGDIRYAEHLHSGRHVAELVVRDRAGNATRRAWTFDVAERGRHDGYDDGR